MSRHITSCNARNDRERATQVGKPELEAVDAVERDGRACARLDDAQQREQQTRLARSRATDKPDLGWERGREGVREWGF
jgi:hypothetical protein